MAKNTLSKSSIKVGIVGAVLGALLQLSGVAEKFPWPLSFIGNIIVFISVILICIVVIRDQVR